MKVNLSIDSYNIDAPVVLEEVLKIKHITETLGELGAFMLRVTLMVGEDFDSKNYFRIKESLEKFLFETKKFDDEIQELVTSVKQLLEKLEEIWR